MKEIFKTNLVLTFFKLNNLTVIYVLYFQSLIQVLFKTILFLSMEGVLGNKLIIRFYVVPVRSERSMDLFSLSFMSPHRMHVGCFCAFVVAGSQVETEKKKLSRGKLIRWVIQSLLGGVLVKI